jgi:hypothetical protein
MSGFVEGFVGYLKRRTDCPPDFHTHAALVTLATALGNRVWCHGWTRTIYPNLWAVVIAPSGYGKSAPLDMAERIMRKAQFDDRLLPNSFSYEALLSTLKAQPVGVFVLQEFANFVAMMGRDYNSGCRELLSEIYDSPPTVKRVTMRGDTVIDKPCLSILGASSPSWFAESLRGRSPEGGFLERIIFCPSIDAGPPVDYPGPPDEGAESVLADHVRRAASLSGGADISVISRTFSAWQRDQRRDLRRRGAVEFGGMLSRAPLLVLKSAILFRVSRDPTGLQVTQDDLDRAINYVEYSHSTAQEWLANEVARDGDEADRLKLVQRLREQSGRMTWSDLLRTSHMRADKFAKAVDTLRQAGRVDVADEKGESGRRVKCVRLAHANGHAPGLQTPCEPSGAGISVAPPAAAGSGEFP